MANYDGDPFWWDRYPSMKKGFSRSASNDGVQIKYGYYPHIEDNDEEE